MRCASNRLWNYQSRHDIGFITVRMAKSLFIVNDPPYGSERSYWAQWADRTLVF